MVATTFADRLQEWFNRPEGLTVAERIGQDITVSDRNPFSVPKKVTASSKSQTKHSRIRVQLSRPLRVAEIEKLTTDHNVISARLNTARDANGFLFKLRVSPNGTHLWVDADVPSRDLYEIVATALDQHFVNVYPTAVRTFTEYNGK